MVEYGICTNNFFTKSAGNGIKNTTIYGYAAVYIVTDSANDIISAEAMKNVDANAVKFLWQHDISKPIGKINNLVSDHYGLRIEAEINNETTYGREASSLIKQGAVSGLSIGFKSEKSSFNAEGTRVIEQLKLYEVSIVTFPANEHAQIDSVKRQTYISQNERSSKNERDFREYQAQLEIINKLVGQL